MNKCVIAGFHVNGFLFVLCLFTRYLCTDSIVPSCTFRVALRERRRWDPFPPTYHTISSGRNIKCVLYITAAERRSIDDRSLSSSHDTTKENSWRFCATRAAKLVKRVRHFLA